VGSQSGSGFWAENGKIDLIRIIGKWGWRIFKWGFGNSFKSIGTEDTEHVESTEKAKNMKCKNA
jgi:hypothetical protein